MDASDVFRHVEGFGPYQRPRPPQAFHQQRPADLHRETSNGDGESEASHRIAHTLTACCRCRQRKTRCDPTLPRCLPCERSGSVCEYFDTTKGKKISRYYVVKLQEKVRALEAELGQYTEEEDFPRNNEELLRPGGLVRLNESDETPRYLGPSSGIAMTRMVMEEAKRFTDSTRISELVPSVRDRRQAAPGGVSFPAMRSMSFSIPPNISARKKSFPIVSSVPAATQVFTPVLHERKLESAIRDVYSGSRDSYQQFIVRMVMAISMQKLDTTYAGLADSYYLSAMQYFEDVIRPKDLKTLQCLILLGQYSLLTPTRTAVYYIIGLATSICQQMGLADEKTISLGIEDPLALDMRRRLSWIVMTNEFGLAYSMGRPSGFAKSDDLVDVGFFSTVDDGSITENGILSGPTDARKLVAIHFCKMRLFQNEIRRVLYEKKQPTPRNDRDPWFSSIESRMEQWINSTPENPAWCKPWFTGRYHTMVVALYRPSPQVPKPSANSAIRCFASVAFVINISSKQVMASAIDITWVFLLTLYMSVNTILWTVASYPEVRSAHPRDEVQELINVCLDIIDSCAERWPGTSAASKLYAKFAEACLKSYEARGTPMLSTSSILGTPPSQPDTNSPASEVTSATNISQNSGQMSMFNPPQFGYVFDTQPEQVTFDSSFPAQPSFRSNSIFLNPASTEPTGRRFSYFPPEFNQSSENLIMEESTPPGTETTVSPPILSPPDHLPTPPDSIGNGSAATPLLSTPLIPTATMSTPIMKQAAPVGMSNNMMPQQQRAQQPAFTIPPLPPQQHQLTVQRPLPPATTVTDWFNPPPPFISPYAFGNTNGNIWNDPTGSNDFNMMGMNDNPFPGLPPERQGSLSQSQQIELMGVLENEGMTHIDTYLNGFNYGGGVGMDGNVNWHNTS
ncbi:putative Zn(2)-C6 fungal-type domain-containing protein [Seiridium unicorne]|uniref:Zn(2)-C6 fungal-type domain-containing protein n=1 Tax=Seiridium unicorne TaxID=138068 RepID=A0ABR2UL96_9PEZI